MKPFAPLALAAALAMAPAASALEITFYPGERLYAYEADAQRGAQTLLVHNIGIRNDTAATVTLSSVAIDLMSGERVVDTRTLDGADLARAAASGAGLQQAGLDTVLAFQFGGTELLPAGTKLSSDLTLEPGEAVIVTSQVFAYRGARDAVRVRVNGGAATAQIPVRSGLSQRTYALPVRGVWYNGAGATLHSHHRWTPLEEFAFDFVRLGADMKTHRGAGRRFSDYHAYGQPVYAAADGRVVAVIADQPEDPGAMRRPDETPEQYFARLQQDQFKRLALGAPGILGNAVVIDHGDGEFSSYAHLKPGSVAVRVGDVVKTGHLLAQIGSSGNSTEPHLHFQVCNRPDPLMCAGIPVKFELGENTFGDPPHAPQSGEFLHPPAAQKRR
ncbi:MAG: M23 family metallopeptidase [Hyphomonadaceae bacterium]|nr:M23 family metallopeptidase [Hyphomonadaceae bacterium]